VARKFLHREMRMFGMREMLCDFSRLRRGGGRGGGPRTYTSVVCVKYKTGGRKITQESVLRRSVPLSCRCVSMRAKYSRQRTQYFKRFSLSLSPSSPKFRAVLSTGAGRLLTVCKRTHIRECGGACHLCVMRVTHVEHASGTLCLQLHLRICLRPSSGVRLQLNHKACTTCFCLLEK